MQKSNKPGEVLLKGFFKQFYPMVCVHTKYILSQPSCSRCLSLRHLVLQIKGIFRTHSSLKHIYGRADERESK